MSASAAPRLGLRFAAFGYLLLLLGAPVGMIFYRTFEHGLTPVWEAVTQPGAVHAFWLSIELVAIVVPLNTVFGIGMALLIERGRFRGRSVLGLLLDLPFAISPVVVGLALVLVYGRTGWFGGWLTAHSTRGSSPDVALSVSQWAGRCRVACRSYEQAATRSPCAEAAPSSARHQTKAKLQDAV